MLTKKFLILINLFLLIISPAHGEAFSPTLLQLSAPEIIPYSFDGSEIEITVTVSGTPASLVFLVFTKGKGSTINNVRNGYLGWHYVNKIDTCVYVSPDYQFLPGDHVITWDGRDADGNPVVPGAYTYYMWAYDNVSSKQLAAPLQAFWEDASAFKTHNADGIPLSNPILFSSLWESSGGDFTERSRQKWIIGADPAETGTIETCSYMGWSEHAPLVPDPYSDDMFFIMTVDNNLTAHLMKYSWVPNGTGELQTGWGADGEVTWNITTTPEAEWPNYSSAIYAGNDVIIGTNTDISGVSTESELVLIDAVDGYEIRRIDLSEWWIRVPDGEEGQQSSGPNDFDVRHGLLFMGAHSTCLNQVINPFDEDWNRWVNQNGDYVGDHNFEETADNPWVCHDYNVGPYKYQFTADDNLFSIFPSYDMGAVSFGLYAPDGTGLGYYAYAGETARGKWVSRFVDYGSAYDGLYTDNSTGGSKTWHFIGHDSIKGTIASSYLIAPNGGEIWETGTEYDIVWQSYRDAGQVSIEYSIDGGLNWNTIVESIDAFTGRYPWTTPDTGSTNCLVRITVTSNPNATSTSSSVFTISPPFVRLTTPNGGERWAWGKTYSINWISVGIGDIFIEYSTDNGVNWEIITESIDASSGSHLWEIPEIESSECLVRITNIADTGLEDVSDNVFNLSQPFLTILSPNGMEHWYAGEEKMITWDSYGVENIKLEFSVDGGLTWNPIAESVDALGESYLWLTPYLQSALCLVKISDTENDKPVDESDEAFKISSPQSVEESVPKEFEVFQNTPNPFNPTTSITFSLPEPGNVIIDIFNINGQRVDTLANGYRDAGRHTVNWDGSGFSAGLYFYNVKYGGFSKTMKMLLMK